MTPKGHGRRAVPADAQVRRGRLAKARQFMSVADDARELAGTDDIGDAAVILYVHAGIAAADAICAKSLGEYSAGQDHQEAIALLESVDRSAGKHLGVLLSMKTRAGYGYDPVSGQQLARAERAARALLELASL